MKWLGRLLGVVILGGSLAAAWVWMQYKEFITTPLAVDTGETVFQVANGATLRNVAHDLQTAGMLAKADYLVWYGRYTGQASQIRAGEYRLTDAMRPDDLLALLVSGRSIQHSLTLIEGWDIRQVRAAVAGHPALQQTLQNVDDVVMMERLGRAGEHPEGRFFPDTYRFERDTTDLEFLRRAMHRMDDQLAQAWAARAADIQVANPYEALILASIVEKETGLGSERHQIAGVFDRRLKKGMKLQTDPTVIYGMGTRYSGNIRRKDLREDTPYNTYVHTGLPPTPICMPGRAALDAAVNPADGHSLYFVSRGDGSHVFSATLKQHNAAVRKYQLGR